MSSDDKCNVVGGGSMGWSRRIQIADCEFLGDNQDIDSDEKGFLKSLGKIRISMATLFALLVVASLCVAAYGKNAAQQKEAAAEQFRTAENMREALRASPENTRSRHDYERVMEAYRRVYYTAPTYNKADAAVASVAEMLREIGRRFDDSKMSRAAIGQYDFLRKEYPGSKYRINALYAMGQIYQEDLNEKAQAKSSFNELLKHYPHSRFADDARAAISEIDHPSEARRKGNLAKARSVDVVEWHTPVPKKSVQVPPAPTPAIAATQKAENPVPESDDAQSKTERHSTMPLVTGIRHWSTPDYTRVAIDLESEVKYEAGRIPSPDRIFFDLHGTKLAPGLMGKTFEVQDGFLRKIRVAQFQKGMTRVVLDVDDVSDYSAFLLPNPYRLIIDIHGKKSVKPQTLVAQGMTANADSTKPSSSAAKNGTQAPSQSKTVATTAPPKQEQPATIAAEKKASNLEKTLRNTESARAAEDTTISVAKATQPELKATSRPTTQPTYESVAPREKAPSKTIRKKRTAPEPETLAHEARPTSDGERSLIRALGLKIGKIVVDAGHGGHDTGTIGPNGLQEKDVVLDVALRLGKLLQKNMGADVVYTRDDDTFIPLETRTAIANQAQADLFISIHANSSNDPDARGVETYYLNFASSPQALEVAARENAVSSKSIHELQDLVKKITLKEKLDESREFAADVQKSLYSGLSTKNPGIRNRGVKRAPFIVLIGANMPSILAEISFVSNPTDEKHLEAPDYRQKIAEYLYHGVSLYVEGLSGVKVAGRTGTATSSGRGTKQVADSQ